MKYNLVYSDFNKNYVNLALADSIDKSLAKSTKEFLDLLEKIPVSKIDYAYATGKWTVKELLQHIIDAERVFSYRIIRLARLDPTPLPGFDENTWGSNMDVSKMKWKNLVKEFKLLRKSNLLMIGALKKEELAFVGTASNHPISTAAICFILGGHVQHHVNILKERYL
jgi:hypothetical protein